VSKALTRKVEVALYWILKFGAFTEIVSILVNRMGRDELGEKGEKGVNALGVRNQFLAVSTALTRIVEVDLHYVSGISVLSKNC
jgi:hypothetical protein